MKHALVIAITLTALAETAAAGENCTCRARNVEAQEGQTVCLATPNGSQMARCERVLNNTSWKFLGTPCPVSHLSSNGNPVPAPSGLSSGS
jgi:hypothetical protein